MTLVVSRVPARRSFTPVARPRAYVQASTRRAHDEGTRRPPFDLYETADAYVLRAWLPGAEQGDLDLTFEKGVLTVRAPVAQVETETDGVTWLRRELGARRWSLTLGLPEHADADAARATFEGGVLSLHLPKAESARAHAIPVRRAE